MSTPGDHPVDLHTHSSYSDGLLSPAALVAEMGALFRSLIVEIPGVTVVTPANAMAGMVNFNVADMHPRRVSDALYDRGYTIRFVEYAPCVVSARASVSWWNSEAEVRGLADALAEIASGPRDA